MRRQIMLILITSGEITILYLLIVGIVWGFLPTISTTIFPNISIFHILIFSANDPILHSIQWNNNALSMNNESATSHGVLRLRAGKQCNCLHPCESSRRVLGGGGCCWARAPPLINRRGYTRTLMLVYLHV